MMLKLSGFLLFFYSSIFNVMIFMSVFVNSWSSNVLLPLQSDNHVQEGKEQETMGFLFWRLFLFIQEVAHYGLPC